MKKYIMGILTGLAIAGGIGVLAYTINAKQIGYTPKDSTWKVDNVESAINYLKSNSVTLNFGEAEYLKYQGNRIASKSINKELSNGKYLAFITDSISVGSDIYENPSEIDEEYFSVTSTNNSNITKLSGKGLMTLATNGNVRNRISSVVYLIEVSEDNDTITFTVQNSDNNRSSENYLVQLIKVN